MGLLDRAKKLAEQAKDKAEEAFAEVRARTESQGVSSPSSGTGTSTPDQRMGTPYVPGMLGKPGWREKGLTDPAAILPVADRDKAGIPHSTRSEIVEEPFGMGRRWTSSGRSAGLYHRLTPDQRAWLPPGGLTADPHAGGALTAVLEDGRSVVFLGEDEVQVVLELTGIDTAGRTALTAAVAGQLAQL